MKTNETKSLAYALKSDNGLNEKTAETGIKLLSWATKLSGTPIEKVESK